MACLLLLNSESPIFKHEIVVLYTSREPILPDLPQGCCRWVLLDDFKSTGEKAKTVIVAGHGLPPYFANAKVGQVAKAVASFEPELIVMNSCYGASSDMFEAFTQEGLSAQIVAAPFPIYQPGFIYEAPFLEPNRSVQEKMQAIRTEPPYPLVRWKLNAKTLEDLQVKVAKLSSEELKKRLRRVQPPLVRMAFPTPMEKNSEILVPVPVSRF